MKVINENVVSEVENFKCENIHAMSWFKIVSPQHISLGTCQLATKVYVKTSEAL
jgi:hypothetical protein